MDKDDKVIPFQTPAGRAVTPPPPAPVKKRSIHPDEIGYIKFVSNVDSGQYWIDDNEAIVKLFAFLKVNNIKINFGDPEV